MRATSYILIVLGILLLAGAAFDECRGVTHKPWQLVGRRYTRFSNSRYLYRIPVHREQNPELFRQFMRLHWFYAVMVTAAGIIVYLIDNPKEPAPDETPEAPTVPPESGDEKSV